LLSINIDFDDVDDPLGKAKNVAELGRWGNGDVELKIESQDDIPYAIGLVRQALEKQLA
jgi:predicted transport protein